MGLKNCKSSKAKLFAQKVRGKKKKTSLKYKNKQSNLVRTRKIVNQL